MLYLNDRFFPLFHTLGWGGGGGGVSNIKKTAMPVGNFEESPGKVPKSCFVGVVGIFFSPLRATNSCITHNLIFFRLNVLNDTTKAPAVDLLRPNILRGTNTVFLTPKRRD